MALDFQGALGDIRGSQLLGLKDALMGLMEHDRRGWEHLPPHKLARLTRCPVFSQQQMKLLAENLQEEPRDSGKEKAA